MDFQQPVSSQSTESENMIQEKSGSFDHKNLQLKYSYNSKTHPVYYPNGKE